MNTLNELKTRNDLADFLDIPRKKLSYILYIKKPIIYILLLKYPKNGGFREINAPLEDLKIIQKN